MTIPFWFDQLLRGTTSICGDLGVTRCVGASSETTAASNRLQKDQIFPLVGLSSFFSTMLAASAGVCMALSSATDGNAAAG